MIQVCISYTSDSTKELQNVINTELKGLNDWLTTNKLSLNIVKTEFMVVGSRQRIKTLNNEIDIEINGNMVNQFTSVKSLGVHLDNWVHYKRRRQDYAPETSALFRV